MMMTLLMLMMFARACRLPRVERPDKNGNDDNVNISNSNKRVQNRLEGFTSLGMYIFED